MEQLSAQGSPLRGFGSFVVVSASLAVIGLAGTQFVSPTARQGLYYAFVCALVSGMIGLVISVFRYQRGRSDELGAALGLQGAGAPLNHGINSVSLEGIVDGMSVEMAVVKDYADRPAQKSSFGVDLSFAVNNALKVRLAVFKEGLENRPVGFFPAEAAEKPDWMEQAGLRLMCEPPEALPLVRDKFEAFRPLAGENWFSLRLEGQKFEYSVRRSDRPHGTEELKGLLARTAAAARQFD